jgi:hypothetical protein
MSMITMKTNELISSANTGNAEAKAELARRHGNRKAAGKKPIPAVAKFFGEKLPERVKKAAAKAPKVLDADLTAKYEAMSLGFLKSLIGRTKDAAKKAAMIEVYNRKSNVVAEPTGKLAQLVELIGKLDADEQAALRAALA